LERSADGTGSFFPPPFRNQSVLLLQYQLWVPPFSGYRRPPSPLVHSGRSTPFFLLGSPVELWSCRMSARRSSLSSFISLPFLVEKLRRSPRESSSRRSSLVVDVACLLFDPCSNIHGGPRGFFLSRPLPSSSFPLSVDEARLPFPFFFRAQVRRLLPSQSGLFDQNS